MAVQPILIAGAWQPAQATSTFQADNPATAQPLADEFPVSGWHDCERALSAAATAFATLRHFACRAAGRVPRCFAQRIELRAADLVAAAHAETALPTRPRLAEVELPRTTGQLRQAAAAAREGSWALATIDTRLGIRSCYMPLGPVAVFGPNNFPFAFNSVSGRRFCRRHRRRQSGDRQGQHLAPRHHPPAGRRGFSSRAGDRAATSHRAIALPHRPCRRPAARGRSPFGCHRLHGQPRGGLALKHAADTAGKPIYLELSSINPVVVLPGPWPSVPTSWPKNSPASCLMGTGQFCTNPGLVLLLAGPETDNFIAAVAARFAPRRPACCCQVRWCNLARGVQELSHAGRKSPRRRPARDRRIPLRQHIAHGLGRALRARPEKLQTEAFGNASLFVVARDAAEAGASSSISRETSPARFILTPAAATITFTHRWLMSCGSALDDC